MLPIQTAENRNRGSDSCKEVTTYSDPRTIATTYVRNGFGEVIQETSPDRGTTVITRDLRGLPTQITDGRGIVVNMTYDVVSETRLRHDAGRPLTRSYPAATAENITYTWDSITGGNKGKGRITKIQDQSGMTERVYDVRGNITQDKRTIAAQVYTTSYTYDLADRMSQITYPSGRLVSYTRDSTGRITAVQTKKTAADPTWTTLVSSVTRQPMTDLVASLAYGNGLTESNTYSLDHELSRCRVLDGATALVDLQPLRADGLNITGLTDTVTPANSQTFGYSAANRLTSATGAYGAYSWTYDLVGVLACPPSAGPHHRGPHAARSCRRRAQADGR